LKNTENKRRVRREYRQRLAELDQREIAQKSLLVTAGALSLPSLRAAGTVGAYAAMGNEVATDKLLSSLLSAGKLLVLPVVKGNGVMEFRRIADLDGLVPGCYGILEPRDGQFCFPGMIDLLFIPGLAFDRRGGRLGRGKGYYDRFLARAGLLRPDLIKVGLAFSEQLAAAVPRDEQDVPMDLLVTEEEVIICSGEQEGDSG